MSNLPTISINEIQQMAGAVVASGLFPGMKTKEQAFALMLICHAKGLHPIEATERYHVIQGRPSMKAETIVAEFQRAGGKLEWTEYSDERVTGTFTHPQGGTLTNTWDIARAQKAGLANKDNWKNYPASMLASRCASEAIRRIYPGCLHGMHTTDEVQEIIESETLPPAPRKTVKKVEVVEGEIVKLEAPIVDTLAQEEYMKRAQVLITQIPTIQRAAIVTSLRDKYQVKKSLNEVTNIEDQYSILETLSNAIEAQHQEVA